MTTSENNRRIAKNTAILYLRMLFLLGVSLFTSRVVLNTLGVEDYGIYNVVGGVVAMFSLLTSSLSTAISRFITFEIGRDNQKRLNRVFCTSVNVLLLFSVCIVLLIEIVGVWFLNTHLNIPLPRMDAANWVLQCSIFTFAVNLISVPYNACIIAHEKMSVYAYISIFEAVCKLAAVYFLYISSWDLLKTYAIFLFLIALLLRFIYGVYSKRNFKECSYRILIDKPLLREMSSFAGWSFFGNGAALVNSQGISILMNLFFGVTVNAARGIAGQVDGAVQMFVNNFTMALNPQITKSYARNDLPYMQTLVCKGAKYSFFLMMIFAIPFCLETEELLRFWLGNVPPYTVTFVRLSFLTSITVVIANTLVTAMFSTGNIKRYQIIVGSFCLLNFPLTWVAFYLGLSPIWAYLTYFVIYLLLIFIRLYLVKGLIQMEASKFFKDVLARCVITSIVALIIPLSVHFLQPANTLRFIEVTVISFASSAFSILYLGMEKSERNTLLSQIKAKVSSK